ncbi:MAG: hypothetical protein IT461_01230 [Planctomycetes bacterium]|nr:hypothetical protein [Planctomycetota bacterium]
MPDPISVRSPRNVSSVVHDGLSGITSVTMTSNFANDPAEAVMRIARPGGQGL